MLLAGLVSTAWVTGCSSPARPTDPRFALTVAVSDTWIRAYAFTTIHITVTNASDELQQLSVGSCSPYGFVVLNESGREVGPKTNTACAGLLRTIALGPRDSYSFDQTWQAATVEPANQLTLLTPGHYLIQAHLPGVPTFTSNTVPVEVVP